MRDIDIVLTADRTIMNDLHRNWRLALPSWSSSDMMPYVGFDLLVRRSENEDGVPKFAPLALRKLEAALVDKGYSVRIVLPEYLGRYLSRARTLGISTTDPFGKGFSPLYLDLFLKKDKRALKFQSLAQNGTIQQERKKGLKLVVGGSGTWQFGEVPPYIDCIVDGEAERILPQVLDSVRKGAAPPKRISCQGDLVPTIEDMPCIKGPTQFGLVEVGRGCIRRCEFCTVSRRPYWIPLDDLEKANRVIQGSGLRHIQILSEDLLLYGSDGVRPEPERFFRMIDAVSKGMEHLTMTHFSISALVHSPSLFQGLQDHLPEGQGFIMGQTGIETGSDRLLGRIAPNKKIPFKKDRPWREMVLEARDIIEDSIVFPYYTILLGCPGSEDRDMVQTLELLDDLPRGRSVIMPCMYTLPDRPHERVNDLHPLEKEMVVKCYHHNIEGYRKLSDMIIEMYPDKRIVRGWARDMLLFIARKRLDGVVGRI